LSGTVPNPNPKAAARAIDALRRGWPICVGDGAQTLTLLAIETADDARLKAFDPHVRADILLSSARATTLHLDNQIGAATNHAVCVQRAPWLDLSLALALADPADDLATPLKGPFEAYVCPYPVLGDTALTLARHAGLLPAFFVLEGANGEATHVTPADLEAYDDPARLEIVTRAHLPVTVSEHAGLSSEIVAFRSPEMAQEHIALVIGAHNGQRPLVRLHSECLTGDVLGSLKCDCGPQLQAALELIAESGWGVLLYLRQEGRGIGLINKLRAYHLQDQGFDTVDANVRLGFAVDARDFGIAAQMLKLLGLNNIRLLTNNPNKASRLEANGITVARVPHALPANPHNRVYLATKRDRTGHII
jgi:GTP cyclohydrolase II